MNRLSKPILYLLLLSFIFTACNQSGIPNQTVQLPEADDEAPIQDEVPASESALPDGWPVGVLAADSASETLKLFDLDGNKSGQLAVPGASGLNPESLHVIHSPGDGVALPTVAYRRWAPTQAIMAASDGEPVVLRETDSFVAMTGAPGQAALSFSEATFENQGVRSRLYAVVPENAGSAPPVLENSDDPFGMVLKPVGVTAVSGMPQGVWYTMTAWGIGGVDLVFPITRGLYFYDLTNGERVQALDPERNFQGMSYDLKYAASVQFDMEGKKGMAVHDLGSMESVKFALHPTSDRGAGFATFSPDNRFAAWMEATGSWMPDPPTFAARVRIGEIASGGIVQEIDSTQAAGILGWNRLGRFAPVGWIDDMHVLIEARNENWDEAVLLKYNAQTGEMTNFCTGSFVSFVY